jgi:hypothetical protein
MFHSELDMLETRLNVLLPAVDYHVICESALTHSGNPKPLYYAENRERFAAFEHKIIHVIADISRFKDAWGRERYQRYSIRNGLHSAMSNDLIIVGDCDEIPNPDVIPTIADGAELELDFYYYNLNTRVRQGWSIGALRKSQCGVDLDPNNIRAIGAGYPKIENGGWHLSYMGGAQAITEKVQAFMHHDWLERTPQAADTAHIEQVISQGKDLWERDLPLERVALDTNLPAYIRENAVRYGWIEAI